MRLKLFIAIVLLPIIAAAQNGFDDLVKSIETNNKKLISARELLKAETIECRTGIYLSNPEVSYARVNPTSNFQSELVVAQSFDFPSAYVHKSKIADYSAIKSVAKYDQVKLEVMSEAAETYCKIIAINRKLEIFNGLKEKLEVINTNTQKRLDVGEINIIESNRIRTETAKALTEIKMLEIKRNSLLLEIAELNGGKTFEIYDTIFGPETIPLVSDSSTTGIVENHPFSSYWVNELSIAERDIALQKANCLPKFVIGYRQNADTENTMHGFVAGFTIPLFENKNTVKLAQAKQSYLQTEVGAKQLKLENSVMLMIQEYTALQKSANELQILISNLNTPELLYKSYATGQISYTEFFAEYDNYRQTKIYIEDLNQEVATLQLKLHILNNL